jgi:hypothetical protein
MSNFRFVDLDELIKMLGDYNHREFHVHHTWRPNHEIFRQKPDGLYWQEAMKEFHVENNGWSDIAQHVTLLPDGIFVTGRDFGRNPASITGKNTKAFMMEMIGDFDINRDPFDGRQKDSAIGLARYFDQKGKYIRFHNENSSKSCPGTGIRKADFMAEVRNQSVVPVKIPPTVRLGDKNSDAVELLQNKLTALGFKCGKPDGDFGALTYQALIKYQLSKGLTPDGVAGRQTWSKLFGLIR